MNSKRKYNCANEAICDYHKKIFENLEGCDRNPEGCETNKSMEKALEDYYQQGLATGNFEYPGKLGNILEEGAEKIQKHLRENPLSKEAINAAKSYQRRAKDISKLVGEEQ